MAEEERQGIEGAEQRPLVRVVAAVVQRGERYLVTQRRMTAVLPLLWEFPGGKVEPGESDEQALAREMMERLGASVVVGQRISTVQHPYERYTVDLHLYECQLCSDHIERRGVHDFRWLCSFEFDALPFTPADEASMAKLLGLG